MIHDKPTKNVYDYKLFNKKKIIYIETNVCIIVAIVPKFQPFNPTAFYRYLTVRVNLMEFQGGPLFNLWR